jgi:hypothetical protein
MANEHLDGATGVTLIMGQFRYGAGLTLDEAKKNFTANGGGLTRGLTLIEFTDETEYHGVDQMGRFHYKNNGKGEPYKMTEVRPGSRIPASR